MQDPYSAMMHRDERFLKPYGSRSGGSMPSSSSSYYGMPFPSASHTMTQSDLASIMNNPVTSNSGLDFTSLSMVPNGQSSLHSSHLAHMNTPGPAHSHSHPQSTPLSIPRSHSMSMMDMPLPTSSPIPSENLVKTESDIPPLETSNHSHSSPSSSTGTPSTPLDLASPDADDDNRMPPKKRQHTVPETQKDELYWEKRKKNNDSARRSREARRLKEEQIALRVVFLEQENLQLRTEVSLLKSEIEKLRCMLYNP